MTPKFFPTQNEFRSWLERNAHQEKELFVGFYKVNSGKPSMTWSESVDQALCFGWIDGVTKSIDHESYYIRFTPRKPNSIWSAININKVEMLTKAGLMKSEGLSIFALRKEENSKIYSHERDLVEFTADQWSKFKQNKIAWDYFKNQAPSYQKVITHWITSAKQEKTKQTRLEKAIHASENQMRVL